MHGRRYANARRRMMCATGAESWRASSALSAFSGRTDDRCVRLQGSQTQSVCEIERLAEPVLVTPGRTLIAG